MAYDLVDGVPLFGTRFTKTVLTTASLVPGAEYGKNKLTYMEDTYLSQSHVGTHIDGLGHIGILDCYYNQTPMGKFVTQNYLKKLGLEKLKSFATRGVIIDMVKVFALDPILVLARRVALIGARLEERDNHHFDGNRRRRKRAGRTKNKQQQSQQSSAHTGA